jgi:hypothetical protein
MEWLQDERCLVGRPPGARMSHMRIFTQYAGSPCPPKIERTGGIPGGMSATHAREKNGREDEWGLAGVEEEVWAHRSWGKSRRAHENSPIQGGQEREVASEIPMVVASDPWERWG